MGFIKIFLSAVIFANSAVAFAGPKEEAEVAIRQSHVAARTRAGDLLRQDLDRLVQNMVLASQAKFPRSGPTLPEQIAAMNRRIVDQLDRNLSIDKIDPRELESLASSYESLVRERFRASFNAQDLVSEKYLALRAFELPLEGFAALCRTGRSALNSVGQPAVVARLPDAEYSIFVSVGSDGNKVQFNSANPTQASYDRNQVQAALGATAIMVFATAPYVAAAYLAYAVINGAITNDEAVALQNESAEANVGLMHRSATDRDVAHYYSEACTAVLKDLQPMYGMLQAFKVSDEKRAEIIQTLQSTQQNRAAYTEDAKKIMPAQALLALASVIEQKQCEKPTDKTPCQKNGMVYSLTKEPTVKIDVTSEADKKSVAEAQKLNELFVQKYPRNIEMLYQSHAAMESVVVHWNDISAEVENSSFQMVDEKMNLLAKKLHAYIFEVQKAKNSVWAKSAKLVGVEQRLQDQYFALRGEYFQFLTDALKIFFHRADAVKGKQKFQQFLKRFNAFYAETNIHPDVQAMGQAVQSLKKFYETL